MIPSIANIRKAIYCLNKRLDLLEGGELSSTITQLSNRVAALESLLDDDLNPTAAIDKFNEIVAFLDSIDNTETLLKLLKEAVSVAELEELEDNVVMTGSYDATVAVGLADNLRGDTIVDAEFYKRKTGGTQSVGSGIAAIKEVRGKSIVWNQKAQYLSSTNYNNGSNGSASIVVSDGTLTFTSNGTRYAWASLNKTQSNNTIIHTHKYLLHYNVVETNLPSTSILVVANALNKPQVAIYSMLYSTGVKNIRINFKESSDGIIAGVGVSSVVGDSLPAGSRCVIKDIMFFDLTLIFGAGNEPTGAEFEKMFPLDHYDYNAGEVIPFAGQNLVTIGKNQYNPATGKANLLGGQTYQITGTYTKLYPTVTLIDYTYGNTVTVGTYYTNDSNHYVGAKTVNNYNNTKTYALGSYCAYDGAIYKSNVAIETAEEFDAIHWDAIADVAAMVTEGIFTLWDITPDVNGVFTLTKDTEVTIVGGNDTNTMIAIYDGENSAYEPYVKHTLPLDPSQWRDKNGNLVYPYGGMHGNSFYWDYAKVDADGYIRKAVMVWGCSNLGNFNYLVSEGRFLFYIPNDWVGSNKTRGNNVICQKYVSSNSIQLEDKCIGGSGGSASVYFIKDTSYSDTASFKAAMNGVICYYRLKTPVEVELATPIYAKYLCDKDGTEEITPANGTKPYTTMANLSILYAVDARGEIKNLPKNYLSKESAENMLNAMVSAGVIASYTMTWDAANNRYAFVITAPAEPAQSNE